MRIAVSADSKQGLDSVVSPHFGRCRAYVLVDIDGQEVRAIEEVDSPFDGRHEPGQVPAFIRDLGANVMLTGGMGGRAIAFFTEFGIEPVTGAYGNVRQAIESYLGGQLRGAESCKESKEHGHDVQEAAASSVSVREGAYEKDDVGRLREEAEMLQGQLAEVGRRLGRLGADAN